MWCGAHESNIKQFMKRSLQHVALHLPLGKNGGINSSTLTRPDPVNQRYICVYIYMIITISTYYSFQVKPYFCSTMFFKIPVRKQQVPWNFRPLRANPHGYMVEIPRQRPWDLEKSSHKVEDEIWWWFTTTKVFSDSTLSSFRVEIYKSLKVLQPSHPSQRPGNAGDKAGT